MILYITLLLQNTYNILHSYYSTISTMTKWMLKNCPLLEKGYPIVPTIAMVALWLSLDKKKEVIEEEQRGEKSCTQVRGTRVRSGSPKRGHPVFIGSALYRIPSSYRESFWVGGVPEIWRSSFEDKVNITIPCFLRNFAMKDKGGILQGPRRIRIQQEREN